MYNSRSVILSAMLAVTASTAAVGADIVVNMKVAKPTGSGDTLGTVTVSESPYGLVFTPDLKDIAPGLHGFHVHQNASCAPAEQGGKAVPALGAGGHYDPDQTERHDYPWGRGHKGDLPGLYVNAGGRATQPVLAPRLELSDLTGRSLMVDEGGDNYADTPAKLGGGARVACGVVESIQERVDGDSDR